jgi:hypothetical protein
MVICFYWSGVGEENDESVVVEASNGTTPATSWFIFAIVKFLCHISRNCSICSCLSFENYCTNLLVYFGIVIRFGESSSNANIWAHIWEACKRWIARKRILEKILSIAMEDLQHELEVCEDLVQQHWGSQDPFILLYQYAAHWEFWGRRRKFHQGT